MLIGLLTLAAVVLLSSQDSRASAPGDGPEDAQDSTAGLPPPPSQPDGPDFLIPPPEAPGVQTVTGAPSSTQTSEFMAGTAVYSVVFVESSGGSGNCSPADPQTENWNAARQATVLSEISDGLAFWTSRSSAPSPLTFVLDNQGVQPTSCEPITRPGAGSSSDEPKWIADVLTAMGFPATTADYRSVARSFAHSRRMAVAADWGYVIFVVDSLNDVDGGFSNGAFAYAYLNGPFIVMTYDNDGWGINRMNLVTAHETGHIFGALDEYASSGCATSDSWGYLNAANTSCNNGGDTSDTSIMGEASEQVIPAVDVSASARDSIGWRNPAGTVVDVVRTSTVSLTPYAPDPTSDTTPTYSALAGNTPFPPGGCNTVGGICFRLPSPATISSVAGAEWNLDGGAFTSTGVSPDDGAFDDESEPYTFTPPSPLANGTYTFGTQSINNFGHASTLATDTLTLAGPPPTPTKQPDPGDTDGDGCSDVRENGPDETLGGLRDYQNPWDFYDVNGDSEITLFGDILGVVRHYSPQGAPPYDAAYDRGSSSGANPWNMTAPNGVIDLFTDILGVILQHGHDCR